MPAALYLTHPEVIIDPDIPTPRWGLSDMGNARVKSAIARGIFDHVTKIISSAEQKALDTASLIADHLDITPITDAACGENDRESTGFLPSEEFEKTADLFFQHPLQSIKGWETAQHAQDRIVSAVGQYDKLMENEHVLFVGHGAVGTLLKCHIGDRMISRDEDQHRIGNKGGGNIFAFNWQDRTLLTDWASMEDWPVG